MTYLIAAYLFISVSSGIAMTKSTWWGEILASQIAGLFWPFTFTAEVIRKIDSLLK
jgi:hypothetical protein